MGFPRPYQVGSGLPGVDDHAVGVLSLPGSEHVDRLDSQRPESTSNAEGVNAYGGLAKSISHRSFSSVGLAVRAGIVVTYCFRGGKCPALGRWTSGRVHAIGGGTIGERMGHWIPGTPTFDRELLDSRGSQSFKA